MKSFEHGYVQDTLVSHSLLKAIHALGRFQGRQALYLEQFPEVLETLRRVAMVQSAESSNRIEGITVSPDRLEPLITRKTRPKDRSEQEVAGYRDVLSDIHTHHGSMQLSTKLIHDWHRTMLRHTEVKGGAWKEKDNAIFEVRPDGKRVVRFRPVSALATAEYMERLVGLFQEALDEGQVEPLLLIATFVLDFECVHPFMDGNGRIGRLLALLLLYQGDYEVGRYISLERIVEESKETYYEALHKSSQGWHEARHDLRPWWNYFLGMLTAAYKDFEARVGSLTSARGAKREMVENAILRFPGRFRFGDLQRTCPGVSYPTLRRALSDLRRKGKLRCLGMGRDAQWERIGSDNR
ncbi:MAG: Fic family protein [Planctomycetes bacterium]|nr:Fic family protein [Planctomycetota bacterium]